MSYIGPYHHQSAPWPQPPLDASEWRQAPFFELLRNDSVYQGFLCFIPRHDPHQPFREEDLRSWYKAFEILYRALPNCWSQYIEFEGRYAPRPADIRAFACDRPALYRALLQCDAQRLGLVVDGLESQFGFTALAMAREADDRALCQFFLEHGTKDGPFWLTDSQWKRVDEAMKVHGKSDRAVISAIVHVLLTGCFWVDSPSDHICYKTTQKHFRKYSSNNGEQWQAIAGALAGDEGHADRLPGLATIAERRIQADGPKRQRPRATSGRRKAPPRQYFSVTDVQWEAIKEVLAEGHAKRNRSIVANEKFRGYIEGIVYQLRTDCRWEDCPGFRERPDTIRMRYNAWKKNVWPKIVDIIDPEGELNLPREDRKRPASASDTDEPVPSAKRPRGASPVQLLDGPPVETWQPPPPSSPLPDTVAATSQPQPYDTFGPGAEEWLASLLSDDRFGNL